MTRRAAPAPAELVTDWIHGSIKPVRVGFYERCIPACGRIQYSHWDGKRWSCFDTTLERAELCMHIESSYQSEQWRGVRRWVLQGPTDNLMTAIAGRPIAMYLEDARPRSAKWNGLSKARPFRTEAAAKRFAARYSRLAMTAVLP